MTKWLLITFVSVCLAACSSGASVPVSSPVSSFSRHNSSSIHGERPKPAACTTPAPYIWVSYGVSPNHVQSWLCGTQEVDITDSQLTDIEASTLAIDPTTAKLYAAGANDTGVLIFGPSQTGSVSPLAHIDSNVFQTETFPGIASDTSGNLWYVESECYRPARVRHGSGSYCSTQPYSIYEFNEGDHGNNVTPDRVITPNTGSVQGWDGIAVTGEGHVWVVSSDYGAPEAIMKFNLTDSGSTTPLRYIHGSNVPDGSFDSVAVGDAGYVFVGDSANNKIWIWTTTDTGNIAPSGHIACSCFGSIGALAFDNSNHLYVADASHAKIYEFNGTDRGLATPIDTTTLNGASGAIALCYGASSVGHCTASSSLRTR